MFASTVSFGLAKKKLIFSIDHKKTETLTFVFNIVFFSIKTQHPLKRSREGRVILHLSKSFKKKTLRNSVEIVEKRVTVDGIIFLLFIKTFGGVKFIGTRHV